MLFETGDALIRHAVYLALNGREKAPREMKVRECPTPSLLTLNDPTRPFMHSPVRRCNYRFGLMEAAWMLSGSNSVERITKFNKRMANFSDDGETLWGAYGPRLMGQLPHVLNSFRRDMATRQAVVTTWRPQVSGLIDVDVEGEGRTLNASGVSEHPDHPSRRSNFPEWDGSSWRSKDTPCTIAWQFQQYDGKLDLTVFMRSNDVWWGLPYDLLSFTTVQRVVAAALNLQVGKYHHVVGNMHIYKRHWEKAKELLDEVACNQASWVSTPAIAGLGGATTAEIQHSFETIFNEYRAPETMPFGSFGQMLYAAREDARTRGIRCGFDDYINLMAFNGR